MWKYYNPNPYGKTVGDCTVRALAMSLTEDWTTAYARLVLMGYLMGDMPSSDSVWSEVLRDKGFRRYVIPNECPSCYTVADFAAEHPSGTYVLALGGHVVCVKDGDIYDSWDSSREVPAYYFTREE